MAATTAVSSRTSRPEVTPRSVVGGRDNAAVEVALRDDREQCRGCFARQGEVVEFVDDQQGGSGGEGMVVAHSPSIAAWWQRPARAAAVVT